MQQILPKFCPLPANHFWCYAGRSWETCVLSSCAQCQHPGQQGKAGNVCSKRPCSVPASRAAAEPAQSEGTAQLMGDGKERAL